MRITRRHAWALALAGGLVLAGCGDGDEPVGVPEVTARPSTSGTSAPPQQPPALPPAAAERTAEGASAFVEHWFALVNHGYSTGDSGPMLDVSDPSCEACTDLESKIKSLASERRHVEGAALRVDSVAAPTPSVTDDVVIASVTYGRAAHTLIEADGSKTSIDAAEATSAGVVIAWANDAWVLVGMGNL